MTTKKLQAIVLAAGKSSRFNTSMTKLGFSICGQEIIAYPVKLLAALNLPITIVVGYQKEVIFNILSKHNLSVSIVEQTEQKGTGHAVLTTQSAWEADNILIMNGDAPLVTKEIITNLIDAHYNSNATITFVTAHNSDSSLTGYGRVIKENGCVSIVESSDFTGDSTVACCINAGIYIIKRSFLEQALINLEANLQSGEFYITDLIKMASKALEKVETIDVPFDNVRGINTLKELWTCEHIKRSEIINSWMSQGVRFMSPQTAYIDMNVTIASDTTIGAGVHLSNCTVIGKNCFIGPFSIISNSTIYDNVNINSHSVVTNSIVHEHAQVGPFAHINNSIISEYAVMGNYVEVSKSSIGNKTKAKHLSYIGNANIGSEVNIGAGVITCNYNGVTKNATLIKDNAFIGTNSSLIAPVTVEKNAFVAAGSIITKDVPENALAISRTCQINKENYASILKERYRSERDNKKPEVKSIP